jgi:hypothetical protein
LLGAITLTLAYTATYLISNRDVLLAQSVMTIMASVYGILIFWDVHGVIPFEPITFKQNSRETVIGVAVAIITLAVPVLFRNVFQIAIVPLPYWVGMAALSVLVAFVLWRSTFEQARLLASLRVLAEE